MNLMSCNSIKMFAKLNAILICVITFYGCVSIDYKTAQKECESYAIKIYPPKYEDIDSSKAERKDIISKISTCDKAGNTLKCDKSESYYQIDNKIEYIDSNAKERSDYTLNCVIKLCSQRFGDSQCKSQ